MILKKTFALVTLALAACVSTACAQTNLFTDRFTNSFPIGWQPDNAQISASNQQFVVSGNFGPIQTNNPNATYGDGYHPIPISGPLPDNQTLEGRVDLVSANQNDVSADIHFWGEPEAATYCFFKGQDGVGLMKGWSWVTSRAWFFKDYLPLKNQNVTLVLALTRRGSNLEINTRVLDKDSGNAVLFNRTVTDTPKADPVLPSGSVGGALSMPDVPGTPPPVLRAPGNVGLGCLWGNPTNRPQPAAQVIYDNLEVRQYVSPRPNVVEWGGDTNRSGWTGVPLSVTNAVAVAGGGWVSLALRADTTVVAWDGWGADLTYGLSNVVAIAACTLTCDISPSDCHSLALRADGTVVEWGYSQLSDYRYTGETNVPAGLTNVVAVAAGAWHSLALRADGSVVAWGNNPFGETNVPAGLANVVAVAAGEGHSLALRADGTVVAWGFNDYGQTDVPAGLTNAMAVAAGAVHNLALRGDGTLVAWGGEHFSVDLTNVPTGLTNVVAIAAGWMHSLALRADGTVVAWGQYGFLPWPARVPDGLTNVVAVAGGADHTLALLGATPPVVQRSLSHPAVSANGFTVSLPTQSGRVYALEYKTSLAEATWAPLSLVAGTGHERTLTDPTPTGARRFYRVRRW